MWVDKPPLHHHTSAQYPCRLLCIKAAAMPRGVCTGFRCLTGLGGQRNLLLPGFLCCPLRVAFDAAPPLQTMNPSAVMGCAGLALHLQSPSPLGSAAVILPLQTMISSDAELLLACPVLENAATLPITVQLLCRP